jgi:hypothetical protein
MTKSNDVKRSEFVKLMLDNNMDKEFEEINNAQKYANVAPRSGSAYSNNDKNWQEQLDEELDSGHSGKNSLLKVFGIAVVAVVVIIALVALNMH